MVFKQNLFKCKFLCTKRNWSRILLIESTTPKHHFSCRILQKFGQKKIHKKRQMAMGNCLSQCCQKNNVDFYDIFNIYGVPFGLQDSWMNLFLNIWKKKYLRFIKGREMLSDIKIRIYVASWDCSEKFRNIAKSSKISENKYFWKTLNKMRRSML